MMQCSSKAEYYECLRNPEGVSCVSCSVDLGPVFLVVIKIDVLFEQAGC